MPAVVSRTDGSCSAGTSDPEGDALVVAALEEAQEAVADLVGGHAPESRLRAMRVTSSRDRLREPLDARPRGPHRAPRRHPRPLRLGREAAGRDHRRRSRTTHVWLVQQYRHPVGARFWEFPQGAWEEAPDADAEALARGELAEETGLRAATLEHLGRLYFAYGLTDQSVDVWRATGLEPGAQALEPTEYGLVARRFERDRGRADGPRQRDPRRGVGRRVASR